MNNFKKILASTLAAAMVAGGSTLTFARNYSDVKPESPHSTEISILSDLGVILGTSENEFSPEKPVTREQMAALLFRLMLGRDDAGQVNSTNFTDLYEPYYNGAISWAHSSGLILGVSEDRFNPTGGITKQDAMTMLVRALGHENDKMNAGYPWSYISTAARLGLDKGLENVAYTDTLTRAETAKILYNALVSDYVVTKTQNGALVSVSTSIIEDVFGYSIADATVVPSESNEVTLNVKIDGKYTTITVKAEDMGITGSAVNALGKTYKIIYRSENGKHTVLSAVETSTGEKYGEFTVNKNGTVTIGDGKYTLGENGLMMYHIKDDGSAEIIDSAEKLDAIRGFVTVELIKNGGKVTAATVKTYKQGKLEIDKDGKINLAGGKKQDEITVIMPNGVKNGDNVLYRYNEKAEELEVSAVIDVVTGTVIRRSDDKVTIGETVYSIGNDRAGITAEEIAKKLMPGKEVSVLVVDGAVIGIVDGEVKYDDGQYLVSISDARLVFENGAFRYVMTVYADGEMKNVYVNEPNAKAGYIYRYTVKDSVYALTGIRVNGNNMVSGNGEFIQNGSELGFVVNEAKDTLITLVGNGIYTLNAGNAGYYASSDGSNKAEFVTDDETVIVIRVNGVLTTVNGKYASTVKVNEGADVVAVMKNEVGAVETLKYLYISDGSLGNYTLNAETVRVLANNGYVLSDGKVYSEYTVYSFASGKVETMLSGENGLEIGSDYRTGKDGTITADKAEAMQSGKVNGYTSGTVTIGDKTYTVDSEMKGVLLSRDGKTAEVAIPSMYGMTVEYVARDGEVVFIMIYAK